MLSHLLSKLPAPRAADWGWKVSVAICAMCDGGKAFVCASDQKATFGDFSADHAVMKTTYLRHGWWALFAGNDPEHAPFILRSARARLASKETKSYHLEEVLAAMEDSYGERYHNHIEKKILLKYGYTVDRFRDEGKKKCSTSLYNNLCAKIERLEISLQFLVCGFDDVGKSHIFVVDGKDAPRSYNDTGVWAVGSGAHAALSSLAFHIDKQHFFSHSSIDEAIYYVAEAKFMAESSGEVGRDAGILSVHTQDMSGRRVIWSDELQKLKTIWLNEGAPRLPASALVEIPKMYYKPLLQDDSDKLPTLPKPKAGGPGF
jgi:hypothetical protein